MIGRFSQLVRRLAWLVPLLVASAALAQDDRYPQALPATTGSVAPQSDKWSGEPGASGHPLMMPDAILGAVADFKNCLERMWPDAARRGISRATYDKFTSDLEADVKIMDYVDAQPEFTKALWDYLDLLVTDERITKGRELLAANAATFDAVEKAYGVDRTIIAAIWGVETKYGAVAGERPVIRSTATLACVGRRQAYFKDEFLATLDILQRGDIRPDQLKGSWAGAFGATQFMPTAFKRYAVDFDRDGRPPGRPAARRRPDRAGLAARGARAQPRRAAGTAAAPRPAGIRRGRAERAAGAENPCRGEGFPGPQWARAGRLCDGGGSRKV